MNRDLQLIEAIEDLDLQAMETALRCGANVNCLHPDGGTPLAIMVEHSIDSTIQSGGSPGDEPLEYLEILLSYSADINFKHGSELSALECAKAYKSATKVIQFLENYHS